METLSKFFFKSITILATTFTTYSFLNWLFPVAEYSILFSFLEQAYIFIGVTLGIIIAWYVVEAFAKEGDLETIFYIAIIVSVTTYAPVSFVAEEFFKGRALKSAHIEPYNAKQHQQAKQKLEKLEAKKENSLESVVNDLNAFEKSKSTFIASRVHELKTMKFTNTAFKTRAWGTKKYKQYETLITGFNSPKALATYEYKAELKRLSLKVKTEKTNSIYTALIATQAKKVQKISVETCNSKASAVTASILPIWAFLLVFTMIGIAIELLSALPLIISKRISYQRKKNTPLESKTEDIIFLPAPKVETKVEVPELSMEELLNEKFKNVKVGDCLNGKKNMPWKIDAKFNALNKELNDILKENGVVEGRTHLKALKPYMEALGHVKQKVA